MMCQPRSSSQFSRPPPPFPQNFLCPPPSPVVDVMVGRTVRVVPTSNIGPFATAVPVTPVIGSYATTSGLVRVPVMNHKKKMVPSRLPKFPTLSDKSKLNVYISSQPIHNLPEHIEEVYREDLTLDVLLTLVKHDLEHIPVNCKISFIVVDFAISRQCSEAWHKACIFELMDLVQTHPAGNVIRFGMLFLQPNLCIPDTFKAPAKLAKDYFPLIRGVNKCIRDLMVRSCSRSIFGSDNKYVGMTTKGRNWKCEAWEGFNPVHLSSIVRCSKLTLPYQAEEEGFPLNQCH